jgi:hypothetical protein
MSQITEMMLTLGLGFIGLASLAIIISKNANTTGVIQASASGFGNILDVAISPVTGNTVAPNLAYPGGSGIGSITGGITGNTASLSMYG